MGYSPLFAFGEFTPRILLLKRSENSEFLNNWLAA